MESHDKRCVWLAPDLRRVLAPNPSPMTFHGTNTYILGTGQVAVIDPGPDLPAHAEAIQAALAADERVAVILVTHSHLDHSGLVPRLVATTGAPVLAAGPSGWGQSPVMAQLATDPGLGGGEGIDTAFEPDRQIADGDVLDGAWGQIEVIATPGHMSNHLAFGWNHALFTGDLVMGWSTSLVSPPDGDMAAFMTSLRHLSLRRDRIYYPGHGAPVEDPAGRVAELIAHRTARERQILNALASGGPADAAALAARIYTGLGPELLPAATRNVLAHLIDLEQKNKVATRGEITSKGLFAIV